MSRLRFKDFLRRAEDRGLPSDRLTWIYYETMGSISFRKSQGKHRIFRDTDEIDDLLDKYEKSLK